MLGTTEFSLSCGDAIISRTSYEPNMVMLQHTHELAYVSLVVEGRYTEHRSDTPRALHRNMLVFHPAGDEHADCVHDCSMATINVEFHAGDLPRTLIVAGGDAVEGMAAALLSSLSEGTAGLRAAVSALENFLRGYAVVEPSEEMLAIRTALRDSDCRCAVSAVAAGAGIHRAQLHRVFKRTYGDSPRTDIIKKRCATAAELLTSTPGTIAEIAATCGFYDQSQFCRQFKALTGLSPRKYRLAFQLQ
jgi:AraC family transcriptional regulator